MFLRSQAQKLENKLRDEHSVHDNQRQKLREMQHKMENTYGQVMTREKTDEALEAFEETVRALQQELNEKDEQIKLLKTTEGAATAVQSDLQERVNAALKDVKVLRSELTVAEQHEGMLKHAIEEQHLQFADKIKQMDITIVALEEKNRNLQDETEVGKYRAQAEEMQASLEEREEEMISMHEQAQFMERDAEEMLGIIETLETGKQQEIEAAVEKERVEVARVKLDLEDKEKKLEALRLHMSSVEAFKSELEERLMEADADIEKFGNPATGGLMMMMMMMMMMLLMMLMRMLLFFVPFTYLLIYIYLILSFFVCVLV
jgi:chromosome segregation ATPase